MSQQDWQTPRPLFELLEREFGRFTFDLAAAPNDALCARFASGPCAGDDCRACGIHYDLLAGELVFCNPPYDNPLPWIRQFSNLATAGNTVVAILQAQTGSRWFKLAEATANEIRLMHGRIQFVDPLNARGGRNRFDSTIVVWRPGIVRRPAMIWVWDWRQELCQDAGVPVFVKQMGSRPVERGSAACEGESLELVDDKGGDWSEWPDDLRVREFPQ